MNFLEGHLERLETKLVEAELVTVLEDGLRVAADRFEHVGLGELAEVLHDGFAVERAAGAVLLEKGLRGRGG